MPDLRVSAMKKRDLAFLEKSGVRSNLTLKRVTLS